MCIGARLPMLCSAVYVRRFLSARSDFFFPFTSLRTHRINCLAAVAASFKVVGNNRTKAALVGLQGMVQKAVGLGGWHHILTEDGSSVRVQRNALSLVGALPAPTPVLLAAKPATLGAMALSADMRALEAHADKVCWCTSFQMQSVNVPLG